MTYGEALATLGLPATFSAHDLKRAYRRTASINHPDRGGSTERMVLVNEAYAVLSNGHAFYGENDGRAEPEHPAERHVRHQRTNARPDGRDRFDRDRRHD